MNADLLRREIERHKDGVAHLERAYELLYGTSPSLDPVPQLQALPAPEAAAPSRASKQRVEEIPQFEVARGVAPVRRGELRACSKCGAEKGCTAFKRGSTVCRLCDVGTPQKKNHGGTATAKLTKTCATCGEEKNVRAYWGGGDVCRSCQSGKVKTGGVTQQRRGRPPKEKPEPAADIRHTNIVGDLPPSRFRVCQSCGKTYQITAFPDRNVNVCKHCLNNARPRE